MYSTDDITRLVLDWQTGDRQAKHELITRLFTLIKHSASRRLAASNLQGQLQTTELVNEVYLKLQDQNTLGDNRGHFLLLLAKITRRVLVDLERGSRARKRGRDVIFVNFDENRMQAPVGYPDWMTLHSRLCDFEDIDSGAADVVAMRLICGLNIDETAQALGVSPATVSRKWRFARAWLQKELSELNLPQSKAGISQE